MIIYDRSRSNHLRQKQRVNRPAGSWDEYEQRKAAWVDMNPLATPAEYTAAMRRLQTECGIYQ